MSVEKLGAFLPVNVWLVHGGGGAAVGSLVPFHAHCSFPAPLHIFLSRLCELFNPNVRSAKADGKIGIKL